MFFERFGFSEFNQDGRILDLMTLHSNMNRDGKKTKEAEYNYFTGDKFQEDLTYEERIERAKQQMGAI